MTRPPIAFEPALVDDVTAVLIPMDGITRRTVTAGVDVELWDRVRDVAVTKRLVRNLAGHHVLLNGVLGQALTFRVSPDQAGYRGPFLVDFTPTAEVTACVVPLERLAGADFDDVATLVRGQVIRAGAPVAGVTVRAAAGADGRQFPATTDDRGVFALAVPLAEIDTVTVMLRFEPPGGAARDHPVDLRRGRTYVFATPVDLDDPATPVINPNRP